MSARLEDLGEFAVIERLTGALSWPSSPELILGVGDDCAVLRESDDTATLVSKDLLIEGVHFRRDWSSAASIGHKALAVNLSDIAAMGGEARSVFLGLALPQDLSTSWLDEFIKGFHALALEHGVALLGGDTTASPAGVTISVTVLGRAPLDRIRYRSGARVGDRVFVTGTLGDGAGALRELNAGRQPDPALRERLERPSPRLAEGRVIAASGRGAMIDLSDGLLGDLGHICLASGVGARLVADAIPLSGGLVTTSGGREAALPSACAGGDDYELCFTLAAGVELADLGTLCKATVIGEIVAGSGVTVVDADGRALDMAGRSFEHFES